MDSITIALLALVGVPTLVFVVAMVAVGPIIFAFRGKAPLVNRLPVAFVAVATVAIVAFVALA